MRLPRPPANFRPHVALLSALAAALLCDADAAEGKKKGAPPPESRWTMRYDRPTTAEAFTVTPSADACEVSTRGGSGESEESFVSLQYRLERAISGVSFIGGGSRSPLWQQMLADVFNLPIHVLALQGDATSWGAAVCAGVGVGVYDWSIAAQRSTVERVVEPDQTTVNLYKELSEIYTGIYKALIPIYQKMNG